MAAAENYRGDDGTQKVYICLSEKLPYIPSDLPDGSNISAYTDEQNVVHVGIPRTMGQGIDLGVAVDYLRIETTSIYGRR